MNYTNDHTRCPECGKVYEWCACAQHELTEGELEWLDQELADHFENHDV